MSEQKMMRRGFLRAALIGGAAAGVGTLAIARSTAEGQYGGQCGALTADNIEGPFYRRGAPLRGDITDHVRGRALILAGTVRSCGRPIANAELDFWQADTRGAYDHTGWTLRGRVRARRDGNYQIDTIVPGHYLNGDQYRPAHIHVKVRAPERPELTTQLYFEGDPYNAIDPWFVPTLALRSRRDGDVQRARFDFDV
jgi:protocatechuate 3,4-dioxygenase beta subunit